MLVKDRVVTLIAMILASRCATTHAPKLRSLSVPANLTTETSVFRGTPLSGPLGSVASARPKPQIGYEVTALLLRTYPSEIGEPLLPRATLFANLSGPQPLSVSHHWAGRSRILLDSAAHAQWQQWQRLPEQALSFGAPLEVSLAPGYTGKLTWQAMQVADPQDDFLNEYPERGPFPRRVSVLCSPSEERVGSCVLSVSIRDVRLEAETGPRRSAAGSAVLPLEAGMLRNDMLSFVVPRGKATAVVVIENPFAQSFGSAIAFLIETQPVNEKTVSPPATDPAPKHRSDVGLEAASRALENSDKQRNALWYLADRGDSSLLRDLALLAEESLLGEVSNSVVKHGAWHTTDEDWLDNFWSLEQELWQLVLAELEAAPPNPALQAMLYRTGGELGSTPGFFREIVAAAPTYASFQERVLEENRLYLEDSNPAARVRAFDFLTLQGCDFPGYDPLATETERSAAMLELKKRSTESSNSATIATKAAR